MSDFDTVVSENEHLQGGMGGERGWVCHTNYVLLPGIRKTSTTPSSIKIALI